MLRIFVFLAFIFSLLSCENDMEKVKLYGKGLKDPQEMAKNIKILYSDSAKVKLELNAPVLNHYQTENPYIEMPKGLTANFFDENQVIKSHLKADYGIRYERDQRMEARKNVVVVNEKGEQLNTEHLIWDEQKQKLLSNDLVTITTKDQMIIGNGFEANQDFTKYKIFNIKGTFSINKDAHD